jgi:hypothetical protein
MTRVGSQSHSTKKKFLSRASRIQCTPAYSTYFPTGTSTGNLSSAIFKPSFTIINKLQLLLQLQLLTATRDVHKT